MIDTYARYIDLRDNASDKEDIGLQREHLMCLFVSYVFNVIMNIVVGLCVSYSVVYE